MEKIKILLVDDQAFIRHIYLKELSVEGFDVACEENGKNALKYLEQNLPHLIVLDVMMPGMDGYKVCQLVRGNEKTKNIPVIFLTANADKKSVIQAIQSGGNDYFVKGPNISGLVEKIHKLLKI